jgi:integrase
VYGVRPGRSFEVAAAKFVRDNQHKRTLRNDIAQLKRLIKGKPVARMLNSSWCRARKNLGLRQVRVHDLKHTLGRGLRAAGVSFEDRQDLLGHRSGRMTTHYSAAELSKLIEAANSVSERNGNRPELVALRRLSVC